MRYTHRRQIGMTVLGWLAFAAPAHATDFWTETQKLTASDETTAAYGWSVSIEGDRAIIGAWRDASDRGSAFVFERGASGSWAEVVELTAADGMSGDRFGFSVSISGDRAVVGANGDDASRGAAYIFERSGMGSWTQLQKLTVADGVSGDRFGSSVSLSGDRALVGAPSRSSFRGAAYVFLRDGMGNWSQSQALIASDGRNGDGFGSAVALSSDRAIVGAWQRDFGKGAAYVFENDALGSLVQVRRLTVADAAFGDEFGGSVSIAGDHAIVGASLDDSGSGLNNSGSAYLFERNSTGFWAQTQKVTAAVEVANAEFGWSVSMSGDRAIAGALGEDFRRGAAYVFERDVTGTWSPVQILIASDSAYDSHFGTAVSVSGNVAVIGAFTDRGTGSAYIFDRFVPEPDEFKKEIVGGPDRNADTEIDHAILVRDKQVSEFSFRITMHYPNLPPALVTDLVPSQWQVVSCVPALPDDLVLVSPEGPKQDHKYRATRINWFPTGNHSNLLVTVRLRKHDNRTYEPHQTGGLLLNAGAAAVDSSTQAPLLDVNGSPLVSQALCVAALQDRNGDKVIDYTGNGDEDRDTLSDYHEACELGTDPCNADTDHDGVKDAVDPDPLNKNVK